MEAAFHPSPADERAEYLLHRNAPDDAGYRAFLARLLDPLAARLPAGAQGLDYGAGPGPVLARMLAARGFPTTVYDPIFAPESAVLARQYDFIACTEVAEHFHAPAREFSRLDGLLRPGGWLGLMTQWRLPEADFARWRYVHDRTHVCFYERGTLEWIAARHGWECDFPAANIALMRKPARV